MGVDGMAYHLVPCDREQGYLMPPSLQEWLPEGDLPWWGLKEFYAAYRETARLDPGMTIRLSRGP